MNEYIQNQLKNVFENVSFFYIDLNYTFLLILVLGFINFFVSYKDFKKEVLDDYKTILISRETSLIGRKEVLSGKAKFLKKIYNKMQEI